MFYFHDLLSDLLTYFDSGFHCLRFNRTRPIDQYVIAQYEVHHLVQVNISAPWHQHGAQQLYFQFPRDTAYNQPEFNVALYNNADGTIKFIEFVLS
jgi:hypothetical protein